MPARLRTVIGLFALLSVAGWLATVAAQTQVPFRGGIDLVSLNVTVTDGQHFVTDLEEGDIEIFEDGIKQQTTFFSKIQQPIALVVLLDTSASMESKLETAQEAAIGFARRMRPGDLMEVIDFDSQVSILQGFTGDVAALERAIRQATVNGSTSLYNAIYVSLKDLKKARGVIGNADIRREAIVVLSDGDDTSSLVAYDEVLISRSGRRPRSTRSGSSRTTAADATSRKRNSSSSSSRRKPEDGRSIRAALASCPRFTS